MATVAAHAKVNLHLAVLARETTGFHQIETVLCALDLADELDISTGGSGVTLEVAGADLGPTEHNSAYRAALGFFAQSRITPSVRLRLTKRIPAGAGLGGGSSDAAATLLTLNALHGYPLGVAELRQVGFSIGSDVPFFLAGHALALGWGRGERLLALPRVTAMPTLLVIPETPISTRDAYAALAMHRRARAEAAPRVITLEDLRSFESIGANAQNDFEEVAFDEHPELRAIKEALVTAGAVHALLTGTGSALFSLFRGVAAAETAGAHITQTFPGVRTITTATRERI
jgi:4-diphosphocytidyl-2-C-methyl-D-erythritol kinase